MGWQGILFKGVWQEARAWIPTIPSACPPTHRPSLPHIIKPSSQAPLVIQLTDDEKFLWKCVVCWRGLGAYGGGISSFSHRPKQDGFELLLVRLTTSTPNCHRGMPIEEARRLARENAKDIIACGFDVTKTFIFSDFDYVGGAFYRNIAQIQRCAGRECGWLLWGTR